jgi:hypothetical protein
MNYKKLQFEREIIDVVRSSNLGINLNELIDRFTWTVEFYHI